MRSPSFREDVYRLIERQRRLHSVRGSSVLAQISRAVGVSNSRALQILRLLAELGLVKLEPMPGGRSVQAVTLVDSPLPMSPTARSFALLCTRLLDINPICDHHRGCPYSLAAKPMIESWAVAHKGKLPHAAEITLWHMRRVKHERSCAFTEVAALAQRYLDDPTAR